MTVLIEFSVYRGRLWSFDGVHVIFKEWENNNYIQNVDFSTTTFTIQIHGLPPKFMHVKTARMIGTKIGQQHEDQLNSRVVFSQRFLKIRVDIEVGNQIS